ncbi:hypothetical protein F5879DRAFT_761446, partial [Lentinula edodes]
EKCYAKAGVGVFIAKDHPENTSAKLPNYIPHSNQTGEIVAVKIVAEVKNPNTGMTIETDSKYILGLLKNAHELEDTGFINTSNVQLVRNTIASLRLKPTQTLLKWVKGHSGHGRNEGADTMAKEVVEKVKASYINLCFPPTLHVTGAKISAMTQALAYKVIMTQKS